ncbi:MAG: tetratricopeptide repeat protein, partial [Ignavibacteriae bacterium]|nr:tetratricopeptide repeat protein [Ignavibacteriota bacterium]
IPSGNVTFLFTDIEGSTKLAQEFPDTLPSALEKHNSILRNVVEINNGFVFKIVGDAYCCAFQNAADAVKAAVEIQINIENENWDGAVIRIRIGIHSGNAEWNGDDYMGYITLARVARVMSAAYGGQILISNDTYKLFSHHKDTNPPQAEQRENESDSLCLSDLVVKNVCFRDLGERRLKDVIEPIRLYQVESEGLRKEFPPLKTLDARPNNLPVQLTNFIGREEEIRHSKMLLKNNRLLTLTGSGGAGKTRFSLQTGAEMTDEFANGVWFVELDAISDPDSLSVELINVFGLKEEPNKTIEDILAEHLKDKEVLLILDNCEHLVTACAELAERLLSSCPKLKIIATSREALNCRGEQTYRIPPLSLPDPGLKNTPEHLLQFESIRLFVERALAVNPKFRVTNENAPALAEVCSRLDGIPLAIELAATRTKTLTIEKIYERLGDRFKLLTGGKRTALPRQQTLRALIDWSYDLLSENEKILWSRLSVFSGGWTLEAVEEVCSDEKIIKNEVLDLLSLLTEKSVIIYDETKDRYKILESLKQYGIEKLSDGNEIYLKHLNYFSELSEKAKPELIGENSKFWLDLIEADHRNFISAIEWSVRNENSVKGAVTALALGRFWNLTGQYSTGLRLLEIILESGETIDKSLKALLYNWKGSFKSAQGEYEQAKEFYEEFLILRKEIGDKSGVAGALHNLGNVTLSMGDYEQAKNYYEKSLSIYKEIGEKEGISAPILSLGNIALNQGDYKQAEKYFEESLNIKKETGNKDGISRIINYLGNLAYFNGDYEQAKKYYLESFNICKEVGNKNGIAALLSNLGSVASNQGDYEQAKKYYEESLDIRKEIGNRNGIAESIMNLGYVAYDKGDYKQAKNLFVESMTIYKEIGYKIGMADCINNLGNSCCKLGDFEKAIMLLSASEKALESMQAVLDKKEQKIKDDNISKLHEQFSDEEFDKYREAGRKMTLEEAAQLIFDF